MLLPLQLYNTKADRVAVRPRSVPKCVERLYKSNPKPTPKVVQIFDL